MACKKEKKMDRDVYIYFPLQAPHLFTALVQHGKVKC